MKKKLFWILSMFVAGCNQPAANTGINLSKEDSLRYAAEEWPKNSIQKDTAKMVLVAGGKFSMGSIEFTDSKPIHEVTVSSFLMDEHEVTNAQFAVFVKQTGYKTVAERELNPADFPNVPKDKLLPGSAVFSSPSHKVDLNDYMQWWQYVAGANWQHPEGPNSTITGRENHPVV